MIELGAKSGEANEDDSVPVFWGDYLEYMMRKNELVGKAMRVRCMTMHCSTL